MRPNIRAASIAVAGGLWGILALVGLVGTVYASGVGGLVEAVYVTFTAVAGTLAVLLLRGRGERVVLVSSAVLALALTGLGVSAFIDSGRDTPNLWIVAVTAMLG